MISPFRVSEAFSAILYVHYSTAPPQLQLRKNRHSVSFSLYFFKNLSQCPILGVFFVHSEQIKAGKSRKPTHRANESPSVCPVKAAKKRVVSPLFGLQPAECLKFYKPPGKTPSLTSICANLGDKIYPFRRYQFIPPHQSLTRQLPPQGEAFLQESFPTTRQGDEREQYCPPSTPSCGRGSDRGTYRCNA